MRGLTVKECFEYVEKHMETKYATKSGPYQNQRKITPVGCVNHSLGVAQPSVDKVFESMNNPSAGWGVHAILGDFDKGEGKILQVLPWNVRPWGCGSGSKGSYNDTRIQWEICEPAGHTYNGGTMIGYDAKKNAGYFDRMWKMLVAWNVYCAVKFNYSVEGICCHSEAHAKGYASNHADVMHWFPKHNKSMDDLRTEVACILDVDDSNKHGLQARDLKDYTETDVVMTMGPIFTNEQNRSGILASVSLAQFILESGYGKTELAQNANNCFGMKESLSNNAWSGSTWDGKSIYTKKTQEFYNGKETTITARFRKYPCVEDSIADHSAYLLGAKNGDKLRYEGLKGCKKPKKAIQIIKDGGYATDPNYVSKIMGIISRFNLKQYDLKDDKSERAAIEKNTNEKFTVRVETGNLRIRTGPGIEYAWNGLYTGPGVFTIVKTRDGNGSVAGWGLLLSYKQKENTKRSKIA